MSLSRLILIPLFKDLRLVTNTDTPAYVDLNVPKLAGLLPQTDKIFLYTSTTNRTSIFEWNVELIQGFDRDNEASAVALKGGGDINSLGPRVDQYASASPYQLHGRLRIKYLNGSAAGTVNSGLISGAIGMLTYGS